MTEQELKEIESRANAATPVKEVSYDGPSRPIMIGAIDTVWLSISGSAGVAWGSYANEENDCAFFVAARSDIPKLIAEVRRLQEWCDHYERPTDD